MNGLILSIATRTSVSCDILNLNLTFLLLCHSKHSLGSHEYVQNCRKWENEITLQLLSHSTMRRDLARSVSCCQAIIRKGFWYKLECTTSSCTTEISPLVQHIILSNWNAIKISTCSLFSLDACFISSFLLQAEDDSSTIDLEKHLSHVERPFKENVTRYDAALFGKMLLS